MSLSKQLFLFIATLILLLVGINFILSIKNIKGYLALEAQAHAQETATSLGLSLSPYIRDESDPMLESMIKAIFDMGFYQEIKLVNPEGNVLVTVTNQSLPANVPTWFINCLPLKPAIASSEVSDGWNQAGKVLVTTQPGNAYIKLYELVRSSFFYALAILAIAILSLLLLLHFILQPLYKINQLALRIGEGQFGQIDPLPWTKEVRNVAQSINLMSKKIAGVIDNSQTKLDFLGKRLQQDDLTGLRKKASFETDMKQLFMGMEQEAQAQAFVMLIKADSLTTLVKEQGPESIDDFLKQFAENIRQLIEPYNEGKLNLYRFFGSEFVLLIQGLSVVQVEALARSMRIGFLNLAQSYQRQDIAHIGIVPVDLFSTTTGILAAATEAYEQAQLIGANQYYLRINDDQAKDSASWKNLVFAIVDQQRYSVSFTGQIIDFKSAAILMEDAVTQAHDHGVEIIPIGYFCRDC